ncbi:Patj-like protein [Lucilia cuprina]|uniref:Patj-like protein n=1 Tax=Lucilia cuprina TaxID=7375 RepID=A0A0L0C9X4_LUCCU|nr:Patj like protein [Lucilia cuprina]KNC29052.1 Patj-like protein [Lucilia cuprina]
MVLSTEWSQVEVIDLINDGNGLGFILVGGRSTGVVIKALTPGGVAERDGRLQCGDHVLQIGEVNLRGFSSEQVATVLRQTGAQVRLIVARPVESTATDFQHQLASHAPIIPTKLLSDPEELTRHLFHQSNTEEVTAATGVCGSVSISGIGGGGGSGLSANFCSSSSLGHKESSSHDSLQQQPLTLNLNFPPTPDTELADLPLPPIPKELTTSAATQRNYPKDLDIVPFSIVSPPLPQPPTSAAATMKTSVSTPHQMDHIETVIAGITTTQTTGTLSNDDNDEDCCSITSSNYLDSPETETYEVKLRKNVYGLGITVAGYVCEEEDLSGIFVKSIIEGSAAEMSGQIQINDRIVKVDGKTLSGVTNHQAVEILRNTDIEVHLTLERFLRGRKFEHLQVALTELKIAVDSQSQVSLPPSPSIATLSWLPPRSDGDSIATDGGAVIMEFGDLPSRETVDSQMSHVLDKSDHSSVPPVETSKSPTTTPEAKPVTLANGTTCHAKDIVKTPEIKEKPVNGSLGSRTPTIDNFTDLLGKQYTELIPVGPLKLSTDLLANSVSQTSASNAEQTCPSVEALKVAWKSEFPDSEIIVAEINKLSGLGISLEGTVDVERGIEKRPHHYIRSILEDGPVGRQGILKPGDELLQVNEYKLQGLRHTEVVKILKELPSHVKLVCVRGATAPSIINTSQNPEAFETRSLLPGGHQSLQNLMTKAQSESSLYTSSTATLTDQQRSKSLENVSGLALWSSDVTIVEIEKTEQGFGFSILDYQDPLDPEGSVIVIRGLIRGGSAETTNEIFPGDRLVSVGEHSLQGLDLDEAVAILKGMPLGLTKLGICRPLSTSDSNIASPIGEGDSPST